MLSLALRNSKSVRSNFFGTLFVSFYFSVLIFFLNIISLCWVVWRRVIDFSIVFKDNVLISKRLLRIVSESFESWSCSMRNLAANFIIIVILTIRPFPIGEAWLVLSHSKATCIHVAWECLYLRSIWFLSIENHVGSFFTIWLRNTLLIERCFWFWISMMSSNYLFINSCLFFVFFLTYWSSNKSLSFKRYWVS